MKSLLNTEIQQFITKNLNVDIQKLILQKNPFSEMDYKNIINQIQAKSKAKYKLPTWFESENIIYPHKISIEQTSSEITAKYKSELIQGSSIIDLTGGFGVDCFYFSKQFDSVVHCEINPELSEIVAHNFEVLEVTNTSFYQRDGLEILKTLNQKFDWIYIDPSRRHDSKGKVFLLKDCLPDVTNLLDEYLSYSDKILIKTSPIYDISVGLSELKNIKSIHIVAIENEVKELLFEIHSSYKGEITVKTVNLTASKTEKFEFNLYDEAFTKYSKPQKYLYEPNASVMKSQGFGHVCSDYSVYKLHKNSHLFTSENLIDFIGRRFEIQEVIPYKKSEMKTFLQNKKANITVRNFPETVVQIRQKWKIADGGDLYCFFTTDANNDKIVVICNKI